MTVLVALIAAVLFVFASLPIAVAIACTFIGGIVGFAGLASTCPRKLKDDCLFTADVM